ncbi:uncharacterized protein LOC108921644 [Arapaima gigas]
MTVAAAGARMKATPSLRPEARQTAKLEEGRSKGACRNKPCFKPGNQSLDTMATFYSFCHDDTAQARVYCRNRINFTSLMFVKEDLKVNGELDPVLRANLDHAVVTLSQAIDAKTSNSHVCSKPSRR